MVLRLLEFDLPVLKTYKRAPFRVNQDSLGFRIPGSGTGFLVSETWILDSNP